MKKILYIISHSKTQADRYRNVVDTWLVGKDFFVYSDEIDTDKKIIKVSEDSHYDSNEEKLINLFNNFPKEYLEHEWYFFCDNDTFVNTELFEKSLDQFHKDKVNGRVINLWTTDSSLHYLSGGAGFLIHINLLSTLINRVERNYISFADVSLGLNLRRLGIDINNSDLFNLYHPSTYPIPDNEISKYYTFHYLKSYDDMMRLKNLCKV